MIHYFHTLLHSRWFAYIRIAQFALAMVIFTCAALMPSVYVTPDYKDHTLHLIGNALLILSAFVATFGRFKLRLLILFLLPYSLLIELSQWFTPSRQVDLHDIYANLAGLTIGYVISLALESIWGKLQKNAGI